MALMFQTKRKRERNWRGVFVSIALSVVTFSCLVYGVSTMRSAAKKEGLRTAEEAVRRATIQCYALEGRYPASLEYLEEHYGLLLDWDQYFYRYDADFTNLMPIISVTLIESAYIE